MLGELSDIANLIPLDNDYKKHNTKRTKSIKRRIHRSSKNEDQKNDEDNLISKIYNSIKDSLPKNKKQDETTIDDEERRFKTLDEVVDIIPYKIEMLEFSTRESYLIRVPSIIREFEVVKDIGNGFSSVVLLLKNRITNQLYAGKFISKKDMINLNAEFAISAELNIMKRLNHPNIVKFYETFSMKNDRDDEIVVTILEFCEKGSFLELCNHELNEAAQKKAFLDITRALHYMHLNGFAHRDLKPVNFLLDSNDNAKLSDFGFSTTEKFSLSYMGTGGYASPEIMLNKGPYDTRKSDIWSLGVSFYHIALGEKPFGDNVQVTEQMIVEALENVQDTKLKNLIRKCLQIEPKDRATTSEIMNDEYFL